MTGGITRAAPAMFGAVVGALLFVLVHDRLPDDGYITLSYARNLAELGHWGLLADRPSNTATSPLNVWLLAAGTWVTGRPAVAVGALLAAALAATGWWADGLRRDLGLSPVVPYLVVGLLASSPLLASTVGLETFLGCAVLLGVARYAAGRAGAAGALLGMAVLARPDLVVPAAVLLLALLPGSWPRRVAAVAIGGLVALPWHLFAWVRLGGFLPDSVWIKSDDRWVVNGQTWRFADGWAFYLTEFTWPAALALLPVVAGLASAAMWLVVGKRLPGRRAALGFAAAGVAHWGVFALLGTAPYGWYLAPSAACLTVTAAIAAGAAPRHVARAGITAGGFVAAGSLALIVAWPQPMAPMSTNWAPPATYAAIADDLNRHARGEPVAANFEIGTPVFYCRCPLLDRFGDRAWADLLVQQRTPTMSPLARKIARVNFWFREPAAPTPTRWVLTLGREPGAVAQWPMTNTLGVVKWGSLVSAPTPP